MSTTYTSIKSTVGNGGRNFPTDVRIVQSRLNRVSLVPLVPLKEDGVSGPRTVASIVEFQRRYLKMDNPDGRVDPGGRTIRKLTEVPQGTVPTHPGHPPTKAVGAKPETIQISGKPLPPDGQRVLAEILASVGLQKVTVTSTGRDAGEQAIAMYNNCVKNGTTEQYKTYGKAGDQVIDVYVKNAKKPRHEVIALMEAKIRELGPTKVSHHASEDAIVFDVAQSSLDGAHLKFLKAAKAHPLTDGARTINENRCIHVEIPIKKMQPI